MSFIFFASNFCKTHPAVCRHENISGFYRVSSYFLAKLFCDVLPNRSVPVLGFGIITYWMVGKQLVIYMLLR